MDVGNLNIKITADTRGVDAGITKTQRALGDTAAQAQGFGGKISGAFSSIGGVGTLAMGALGGAVLKFGIDSVSSAVNFETAMTNVNSVLQLSQSEIGALSDEILTIGGNSRAGPQRVAEAFYEIVGGVADASTHMDILNASIATAEAGNADLTGTTSALISVMNSYAFEADKASFVSDVLTKTVGAGVGSMDEFASALGMTAGLAAQSGISFDELGGSMAYLTTQGFSAAQAGTRLTAITTAFLKPNEKMKRALIKMGVESGSAGLEMYGLAGMTELLSESMGGSTDAMSEALGTTEALTGALALNAPGFEDFIDNFKATADGATEAAQAIQNASTQAGLDNLSSQFERLKTATGQAITPIINGVVNFVAGGVGFMADVIAGNPIVIPGLLEVDFSQPTNVPVPDGMAGEVRKSVETWMLDNLIVVGTPLQVAFEKILVAADIADKVNTALNMSLTPANIKPIDVITEVAATLIPPSVQNLTTQVGALITEINATGITPEMQMLAAIPLKVDKITTTAEQLGAELSTLWNTTVTMLTPIAILPDGVSIMPTGMPWLDAALGAAAGGAAIAGAADSPAGIGTMMIGTDLAIVPGGISYQTTGVDWIDAVLANVADAEQTLGTRAALTVGADVTVAGTVVNRDGLVTDVTGQTNTILDEAAITVDTPSTVTVQPTLGNGPQVVTGVTTSLASQNYDTTVHAKLTVMTEVNRVMTYVDALVGAVIGNNDPSVGGGANRDNDPFTPMATGGKVPYDNFAALLHKGEIVVPAQYADGMGSGGQTIIFQGGNFLGSRQEVIEWVREGMAEAGL